MTLSNRQIKSAITESNNGICAKRFTEKQEAVFALRHPNFPEDFFDGYFERNCATGAGITLDFVTDSADVTFCIAENSPINGSETSCFEIYVNGTKRTGTDKPGEYTVSLRGESRVTLYYPYFARLVISGITLCDGSSFRPVRQTKSWLALGEAVHRYRPAGRGGYVHDYGFGSGSDLSGRTDLCGCAYGNRSPSNRA